MNLTELRKIIDDNNLIGIIFTKDDISHQIFREDEDTGIELFNLTDTQWDYIRRNFGKCNNGIMERLWDLLEDLARDAIANVE